ncbi:Cell division inhibitor [Serinicoccus hydrothermalis]|uniref:Cell division inhibitor n=1 Tax=Serinicoccus hydrothermalis TaxID=1758689 RepID=A0A1B1N9Y1_9MICO|nr:TIGR01777 family oxidoreductase [Serinicoccus hydrothermalis]ANS78242.1 Cell division inhibitor [Serinicoccus hydrothermalis]
MTDPSSAEHGPRVVAITGASGLIGSALSQAVRDRGDQVLHLVRRDTRPADQLPEGVREATWDPGSRLDPEVLAGVHGVVHLAGAGIADKRWTDERKKVLVSSRLDGTSTIADALAALGQETQQSTDSNGVPRLVSGSAVGFYGDRGDEVLTEESRPGEGFLSQLCQDWEAATAPAEQAGVPVAHVRTGIVLAPGGGALGRLLPLVRLGLGGPLAGGDSWWPWITLHDHVRALLFLLDRPEITGAVNLGGPEPATQQQVTQALASQLHRPAILPVPGFALRLVLGEMSQEILSSTRVLPEVLTAAGFSFDHADLDSAAAWVVEESSAA